MSQIKLFPGIIKKIQTLEIASIPEERKKVLAPLIKYIQNKFEARAAVNLNFICTHNSRRSQLGQAWAKVVSEYFNVPVHCFSGGTEVTSFHINAQNALVRAGFRISDEKGKNPRYRLEFSNENESMLFFSKLYDSPENPEKDFAAVMTCAHADENCPFIPGASARIALDYQDPKKYDDTALAAEKYDERSDQIAAEMIYVFKTIL